MKHLYFVRHGLSVMNKQGIFSSSTDTPLNDEGHAQAEAAGRQLKGAGVDCIVCSPTKRTYDTACIIARQIGFPESKILTHDGLKERDFGPLEGTPYEPNLTHTTDGVEPAESLIQRTHEVLDYIKQLDADTVVVVSHGAVGRAMRHCLHPDIPFFPSKGFGNAEVVQLL